MEITNTAQTVSAAETIYDERQSILSFVTFGIDSCAIATTPLKMMVRQVCYAPHLKDNEKDISFLENL